MLESMEIEDESLKQIKKIGIQNVLLKTNTMYKQIRINFSILPLNFFEGPLARKERLTIQCTAYLLNHMIELLKSVNRK